MSEIDINCSYYKDVIKKEKIINGINVSECGFCCWKHNGNELIENYCAVFNNKCICNPQCYFKQLKRLQEENKELKEDINKRTHCISCQRELENCRLSITNAKYKQVIEEIRNITEKLITELPEYNSCYYKDECGDNCTPKKQSKVEYCCYENVDKILTMISEVLNDRN